MRIILAPAKKMRIDDGLSPQDRPLFLSEAKEILACGEIGRASCRERG